MAVEIIVTIPDDGKAGVEATTDREGYELTLGEIGLMLQDVGQGLVVKHVNALTEELANYHKIDAALVTAKAVPLIMLPDAAAAEKILRSRPRGR